MTYLSQSWVPQPYTPYATQTGGYASWQAAPAPLAMASLKVQQSDSLSNQQPLNLAKPLFQVPQELPHQHGPSCQKGHDHKENQEAPAERIVKHLATAAGIVLGALLLHKLPTQNPSNFKLISPDWKDWGRIIAGILTVGQINKAADLKPPPWLNALQAVAVITPLTMGFNKGSLLQMLFLGPIVAGVVQAANTLNEKLDKTLHEKFGIPPLLTKLAISASMIVVGLKMYPLLLKTVARSGLMGQQAKIEASKAGARMMVGAEGVICARGCCNFVLCLSEAGEMVAPYLKWTNPNASSSKKGGAHA